MSGRRALTITAELLLAVVVVSLFAGQAFGQPILLSYVETSSMAPTMEPGDGFVAIPSAISGDVEEGDVIVFKAQELHDGGLTTHRVVGRTERGYITRGDANPFADQDGDEPPVKDAQVVAEALQVGGRVVVLPNLGTGVVAVRDAFEGAQRWLAVTLGMRSLLGSQGVAYGLLGLSVLAYILDLLFSSGPSKQRIRSIDRGEGVSTRLVLAGLALLLVTTATAAMVVPAGTQQFSIVSAEFDSESPTVIRQGGSSSLKYTVPNVGVVPVHVYLEPASEGVDIRPRHVRVGGRDEATLTLTLVAPADTGYYRRFVTEHRYLALLPEPVIRELYEVHPWLPIVAIDALLAIGLYGTGRALVGGGLVRLRRRESRHGRPLSRRLLRLLYR